MAVIEKCSTNHIIDKKCSKCKNSVEQSRISQKYCKACHAENMRKNRCSQSELSIPQKMKALCRQKTKMYIKRGKLSKEPCYNCGSLNVQVHHSDYGNPIKVHWVCRECHLKMHTNTDLEERINSMNPTKVINLQSKYCFTNE